MERICTWDSPTGSWSVSLLLSISQRAPRVWESSNISHNSSLLSKILFHGDSILLQSPSVREVGFVLSPNWKTVSVSTSFLPDAKFLPRNQNQKYHEIRKEGGTSSTEMYMNERSEGSKERGRQRREVGERGGGRDRRRTSETWLNTVSEKQFDKPAFFLLNLALTPYCRDNTASLVTN